jgi:hypothetical protein
MTNFGLHIQLPMDRLPRLHQTRSVKRTNLGAPLYRHTRFAFLACVRRDQHKEEHWLLDKMERWVPDLKDPKPQLVAISLRQIDNSSYTRTTFNGHTLHFIEDDGYFHRRLPIMSFDPIWIRRAGYAKDEYINWPLSVCHVRFSLSCRSPVPLTTVTHPVCMETENSLGAAQGTEVEESTWPGQEDLQPLQLSIQGTIATDELRYQVIAIQSTSVESTEVPAYYTVICFGLADRHLWMTAFSVKDDQDLSSIAKHVRFPTGQLWKLPNPGFYVFESSMGTFTTQQAGNNPMYRIQYATYLEADREVSLDMNLSSM